MIMNKLMKKVLLIFSIILGLQMPNITYAAWHAPDFAFAKVKTMTIKPVVLSDGIELSSQKLARLNSSITGELHQLDDIAIVSKEKAELVLVPTLQWWNREEKTCPAHFENEVSYEDIYEAGHYDSKGKWIEGRTIKIKKTYPVWVPARKYFVYSVGIKYSIYKNEAKLGEKPVLVYEDTFDFTSSQRGRYDLVSIASWRFFDHFSDFCKRERKAFLKAEKRKLSQKNNVTPSVRQKVAEIIQANQ